jgi:hypothetical protein
MVFPTSQVSDAWGTLEVQQGTLLTSDRHSLRVAAPASVAGTHLTGPGWTLYFAEAVDLSLRPLGFALAFGRAVAGWRRLFSWG